LGYRARGNILYPRVDPCAHDNSGNPAGAGLGLASATTAAAPQWKKRALRSYLAMLLGVARWQLIGVLILTVLYSLTESIGLALLLPNFAGRGPEPRRSGRGWSLRGDGFRGVYCPWTAAVADSSARHLRDAGWCAHLAWADEQRLEVCAPAGCRASPAPTPVPGDRGSELVVRLSQPRIGLYPRAHV
jgi:hypothetical protein